MSGADLAVAAVAVACFYALWWAYSLSVRLRRIERLSKRDSLTGLGSGDWLQTERWPAALRSGRPLGVVYLDLDHLKLTNDTRGHVAGDQYICTAADALRQAVRRGVDEVFRSYQAGDEFIVLIYGPLGDLRRCAESLLQRLAERGVSASLGLAYTAVTEFAPARAELRVAAEAACRQAKQLGGGCAVLADPDPATLAGGDFGVQGNWPSTGSTASTVQSQLAGPTMRPVAQPGRVCRYRNVALTLPAELPVPTCRRCKHMLLSFESMPELAAALEATYRAELIQRAAAEIARLSRRLSQRKLEVALDLSQGYLSRLLAGHGVPSGPLVSLLALLSSDPTRLEELKRYWALPVASPPRVGKRKSGT